MTPEERFERIEKTLDRMANENEIWQLRFKTNLEALQDFMTGAFQRSEERSTKLDAGLDRLTEQVRITSRNVAHLADEFDRHTDDGHGSGEDES